MVINWSSQCNSLRTVKELIVASLAALEKFLSGIGVPGREFI